MTKMATTEEEEELYENLKQDKNRHRYDEITINFGKPVIVDQSETDIFNSISFSSPIEDLIKTPPIPAPRLSKQKNVVIPSTSDILDHQDQVPEKETPTFHETSSRPLGMISHDISIIIFGRMPFKPKFHH